MFFISNAFISNIRNNHSKWKTCWVKSVTATKSIYYQWKALLTTPSVDILSYMDYPHFYKKISTPQSPSMIFQNLKSSIYRGGRNKWSGWIFCSKQIPKVGGTFSSRFSKLDVLPCTVIFLGVLGVLDYKAKSTSYSSVKHLLKTKNKINKKFQKKNKQDKETYSEVYSLTSIYFLTLPWDSSQTLWNLCGCPSKISLVSISITLAAKSRNIARNMFSALQTAFLRKRNQCSVYMETLMSCLTDWFFWEKHLQERNIKLCIPHY